MEVAYTDKAQEDLNFWKRTGNKKVKTKISSLIEAIKTAPFSGVGKPEALKYHLSGLWSRRINHEHRLIYEILKHIWLSFLLKTTTNKTPFKPF